MKVNETSFERLASKEMVFHVYEHQIDASAFIMLYKPLFSISEDSVALEVSKLKSPI